MSMDLTELNVSDFKRLVKKLEKCLDNIVVYYTLSIGVTRFNSKDVKVNIIFYIDSSDIKKNNINIEIGHNNFNTIQELDTTLCNANINYKSIFKK